ncbi:TetR/AcrR family transcriptional regulator [Piscinibacter koreensis]|uniref:TetR/AcrR family transcriptional regulator n=1 Tax=Piscinibacter koreensis TaxID=2742824 RepID=A0A7Y6NKW0_9BURK|nr:TetR/AcrR family transcriptional regulator [Schlegelella koreensis]NUZ04964.1 TetR/AcrR family transcriptional regulator [Schlegelella koreensis]
MPRGRAPGYAMQREQILANAAKLFARQGFTATSMNQVADACGVSKPALYHYVDDKHQLLVEIAANHVDRLLGLIAEVEAAGLAPEPMLRALIERFLALYADTQAEHQVLTGDVRFLEPPERERVLDGQRRVVAAFAAALVRVVPELRDARLETPVAMLLFGMMNWTFTWLQPHGRLTHADVAPLIADLLLGGVGSIEALGAPPATPSTAPRAKARSRTPPAAKAA